MIEERPKWVVDLPKFPKPSYGNLDKESIKLLQNIDCNCNNCVHMVRDRATYDKWSKVEKMRQFKVFEQKKKAAFDEATLCPDPVGKQTLLHRARKMTFMFDQQYLLSYGTCSKYNKPVSFIPNICQLETQHCFQPR